jgi:hypothetical protein
MNVLKYEMPPFLKSNENSSNQSDFYIDLSTKNEKSIEEEKSQVVSSILISLSNSTDNDHISENSKSKKVLDKIIPLEAKKIFKIIYSNDFTIFNYGIYDNYSNKMIYEALNDTNNNCKKVKSRGSKFFTLSPKKPLKKKKYILQRKQNSDNIRKKIKTRFLKSLKKQINQKLKKAGSKYIFANLQQSFICNLSKEKNKKVLDLTLEEIFSKNFCEEKEIKVDKEKYEHNLKVLKYLEDNKEISEKSNFNNIKNMKFSQIFSEYLESKEFGKEISTLKQEKENDKYIKDYIIKARNFLYFFNH